MSRLLFKPLLATLALAALAVGAAGAVSAAPVFGGVNEARPAQSLIQPVHWEYHHHHRFWVSDHHRR